MFKKIVLLVGILLLICTVYGEIYFDELEVKETENKDNVSFTIDKVENQKYILKFQHYGNINESMRVYLYLNDNLVYTIDEGNKGSPSSKKNESIDITNYLKNGENILKLVGENLAVEGDYNPYYKLRNITINPTAKAPIPFGVVIFSLIGMAFLLIRYSKN